MLMIYGTYFCYKYLNVYITMNIYFMLFNYYWLFAYEQDDKIEVWVKESKLKDSPPYHRYCTVIAQTSWQCVIKYSILISDFFKVIYSQRGDHWKTFGNNLLKYIGNGKSGIFSSVTSVSFSLCIHDYLTCMINCFFDDPLRHKIIQ